MAPSALSPNRALSLYLAHTHFPPSLHPSQPHIGHCHIGGVDYPLDLSGVALGTPKSPVLLGQGGFGRVLRHEIPAAGREVAVKVSGSGVVSRFALTLPPLHFQGPGRQGQRAGPQLHAERFEGPEQVCITLYCRVLRL